MATDVNGEELMRGDLVVPSQAMRLDNPDARALGYGEIIHIFSTGIHVCFGSEIVIANSGKALQKVRFVPI